MKTWSGLGVNYKSLGKIADDIIYFNSIGLHYIRMHVPYAPVPWQPNTLANWRGAARRFHNAGFHVMWGFSSLGVGTTITSSNWSDYANSVVNEARYCQKNDVCDLFIIGNELESYNDNTTLSDAQLRSNIRDLDVAVKAVSSIPTIYCSEYGSSASTFGTYQWIQEGKGTISCLGANLYGNYDAATNIYFPRYAVGQGGILPLNSKFGNEWMISEFNVDATASVFNVVPDDRREKELATYLEFMKAQNVPRAYLYQYRAFLDDDQNDSFYLRDSNGSFKKAWYALATNNKRRPVNG